MTRQWRVRSFCLVLAGIVSVLAPLEYPVEAGSTPLAPAAQETISWGTIGPVQVTAIEKAGALPRLRMRAPGHKLEVRFGRSDREAFRFRSLLRFKRFDLPFLPVPLLLVVAAAPGGSDTVFDAVLIGAPTGKLRVLTPQHWHTTLEGGLHLGPLGADRGSGVAVWNMLWNPGQSRLEPHRYEVQFYLWQRDHFATGEKRVTAGHHESWEGAAKELGVTELRNVLLDFEDFEALR